jgi:ABC-type multidrug transport system fused ATPase/permease subunit
MAGNAINNAVIAQDAELAEVIKILSSDPTQLHIYLTNNQTNVYNKTRDKKKDIFGKVYGDLDRSTKYQQNGLLHNQRNKYLITISDEIYQNQEQIAGNTLNDNSLAHRKQEMNEWSVQNKQETLFIFSTGFILMSVLLLLTGLYRMGIISSSLWLGLGIPLILLFVIIIIYRANYTKHIRNQQYWNNRKFEKVKGKTIVPLCPTA